MEQILTDKNCITEAIKASIEVNFKNTELGLVRVARNLGLQALSTVELVAHCQKVIHETPIQDVEVRGKNYYFHCANHSTVLTINRSSLGIITAKRIG